MEGYKFIKEVNSDIEMLKFMRESEDNMVDCDEDYSIVWRRINFNGNKKLVGENLSHPSDQKVFVLSFNDNKTYKCYSKITDPLDEVNIDMKGSFSVSDIGDVFIKSFGSIDKSDCKLFALLNTFKTQEQARQIKDKILWILALSKIKEAIDGDFEPDWYNCIQHKYYIEYVSGGFQISQSINYYCEETIYFSSEEKAQQALQGMKRLSDKYGLGWF